MIGENLADGRWHTVRVNVASGSIVIAVDSLNRTLTPSSGSQAITDLKDTLSLGALSNDFLALGITLGSVLGTFSGCSKNLTINGQVITFETAQKSGGFPLAQPGCRKDENCRLSSCANGGTCDATWTGFECRCLSDFLGSSCKNGK